MIRAVPLATALLALAAAVACSSAPAPAAFVPVSPRFQPRQPVVLSVRYSVDRTRLTQRHVIGPRGPAWSGAPRLAVLQRQASSQVTRTLTAPPPRLTPSGLGGELLAGLRRDQEQTRAWGGRTLKGDEELEALLRRLRARLKEALEDLQDPGSGGGVECESEERYPDCTERITGEVVASWAGERRTPDAYRIAFAVSYRVQVLTWRARAARRRGMLSAAALPALIEGSVHRALREASED